MAVAQFVFRLEKGRSQRAMRVGVDHRSVGACHVVGVLADVAAREHGDRAKEMVGVLLVDSSLDMLFLLWILQSALQADANPAHATFQQRSPSAENFRALQMLDPRMLETDDVGLVHYFIDARTALFLAVQIPFVSSADDQT